MKSLKLIAFLLMAQMPIACDSEDRFDLEEYNQIQPGMDENQVEQIAGKPDMLLYEARTPDMQGGEEHHVSYGWKTDTGVVAVMFTDGQVSSKTQLGSL